MYWVSINKNAHKWDKWTSLLFCLCCNEAIYCFVFSFVRLNSCTDAFLMFYYSISLMAFFLWFKQKLDSVSDFKCLPFKQAAGFFFLFKLCKGFFCCTHMSCYFLVLLLYLKKCLNRLKSIQYQICNKLQVELIELVLKERLHVHILI